MANTKTHRKETQHEINKIEKITNQQKSPILPKTMWQFSLKTKNESVWSRREKKKQSKRVKVYNHSQFNRLATLPEE